jgi:hypothetical protein
MITKREGRPADLLPDAGITQAWSMLAGCGAAQSYIGCSSDGFIEIALSEPGSRSTLAIGRGLTLEQAICAGVREIEQKKGGQS